MTEAPEYFVLAGQPGRVVKYHRFSSQAMATTFEILIANDDYNYARQAAQAAFEHLQFLEGELSKFVESSDISRINTAGSGEVLTIGMPACQCLERAMELNHRTDGAFDVTFGSKNPAPAKDLLLVDSKQYTVKILQPGVEVDLGGIGKGYAVDNMSDLLCRWSIESALVNGGCSSIYGFAKTDEKGWPITIKSPNDRREIFERLYLNKMAVGGSGLEWGPHIIDTKTNAPVQDNFAAWVVGCDATLADALSTAFMIMSTEQAENYCRKNPDVAAMVMQGKAAEQEKQIVRFGNWPGD